MPSWVSRASSPRSSLPLPRNMLFAHTIAAMKEAGKGPDALVTAKIATDLQDSICTENTEILSSAENEHVFLVYFFIFTMQEFAGELASLIDVMGQIYSLKQAWANHGEASVGHEHLIAARKLQGRVNGTEATVLSRNT
ncbi:hypothetical protein DFH08DRAFT_962142 [Mycena albidolilacea]|uniref:Uncharacterized protein n=1 Tax=Mycena albidolilacea TaxID=1033008 RepID=A0AAD7EP92_9AGAR|nr:hypothetical protein DFH08DRAFT_962142 [Mycena albidolilacea]